MILKTLMKEKIEKELEKQYCNENDLRDISIHDASTMQILARNFELTLETRFR